MSEVPINFWNVALEKMEMISRTDCVKNEVLHRDKEERNTL
jgi:hypothetical protein